MCDTEYLGERPKCMFQKQEPGGWDTLGFFKRKNKDAAVGEKIKEKKGWRYK